MRRLSEKNRRTYAAREKQQETELEVEVSISRIKRIVVVSFLCSDFYSFLLFSLLERSKGRT
jgi:hypothetical protein